jgi:hypothetical protein
VTDAQTLELLSWVARERRSYPDALEVWQTHCPRHSVWEDALGDGLIRVVRSHVELTDHGREVLAGAQALA